MTKGKSTSGGRAGSQSKNASRASASDRQHDEKKLPEGKSIKLGSENAGKRKKSEGGEKR